MNPVIASETLERGEVWGEDDATVRWACLLYTSDAADE